MIHKHSFINLGLRFSHKLFRMSKLLLEPGQQLDVAVRPPNSSSSTTSDYTPSGFPILNEFRSSFLPDLSSKIWDCRRSFNEFLQLPLNEDMAKKEVVNAKKNVAKSHKSFQKQVESIADHIQKAKLYSQELTEQLGELEPDLSNNFDFVDSPDYSDALVVVRPLSMMSIASNYPIPPPQTRSEFKAYMNELASVAAENRKPILNWNDRLHAIARDLLHARDILSNRLTNVRSQLLMYQPAFAAAKKREKKDVVLNYVKATIPALAHAASALSMSSHSETGAVSSHSPHAQAAESVRMNQHRRTLSKMSEAAISLTSAMESNAPSASSSAFASSDGLTEEDISHLSSSEIESLIHRDENDVKYLDRAVRLLTGLAEDVKEVGKGMQEMKSFWEDTDKYLRHIGRVIEEGGDNIWDALAEGSEIWGAIGLRLADFVKSIRG